MGDLITLGALQKEKKEFFVVKRDTSSVIIWLVFGDGCNCSFLYTAGFTSTYNRKIRGAFKDLELQAD